MSTTAADHAQALIIIKSLNDKLDTAFTADNQWTLAYFLSEWSSMIYGGKRVEIDAFLASWSRTARRAA